MDNRDRCKSILHLKFEQNRNIIILAKLTIAWCKLSTLYRQILTTQAAGLFRITRMIRQETVGCCHGINLAHTFRIRFRIWCKRNIIKFTQAEPFAIHWDTKFAKVYGLHCSLGYLVRCRGGHVALRGESCHDGSGVGTTTQNNKNNKSRKRSLRELLR